MKKVDEKLEKTQQNVAEIENNEEDKESQKKLQNVANQRVDIRSKTHVFFLFILNNDKNLLKIIKRTNIKEKDDDSISPLQPKINLLLPNVISRQNLFEGSKEEKEKLVHEKEKLEKNIPAKRNELSIPKNMVSGMKQKILQYLAQNPQDNPGIELPSENMIKSMKPIAKPQPKKKNNLLQAILELRNDEDKLKKIQDEAEEIGKKEEIKNLKVKTNEKMLVSHKTLVILNQDEAFENIEFDDKLSDIPNKKLKQQIFLFLNIPEFSRMVI